MDTDWYALLELKLTATVVDIKKAYRRKALTCHPDKVGADDLKAAEKFLQLSRAVDVLTDPAKRKEYDAAYGIKMAQQVKRDQLDSSRRKRRDELEEREAAAKKQKFDADSTKAEIERLRELGRRMLDEMDAAEGQFGAGVTSDEPFMSESNQGAAESESEEVDVVVRWDKSSSFTQRDADIIFSAYGQLSSVALSSGVLISFHRGESARALLAAKDTPGLAKFQISFASDASKGSTKSKSSKKPTSGAPKSASQPSTSQTPPSNPSNAPRPAAPASVAGKLSGFSFSGSAAKVAIPVATSLTSEYELQVLEKMKRKQREKDAQRVAASQSNPT